jgi:hypothetical protein
MTGYICSTFLHDIFFSSSYNRSCIFNLFSHILSTLHVDKVKASENRIRKYKKYRKHNGHTERYKKTNDDLHYNEK